MSSNARYNVFMVLRAIGYYASIALACMYLQAYGVATLFTVPVR